MSTKSIALYSQTYPYVTVTSISRKHITRMKHLDVRFISQLTRVCKGNCHQKQCCQIHLDFFQDDVTNNSQSCKNVRHTQPSSKVLNSSRKMFLKLAVLCHVTQNNPRSNYVTAQEEMCAYDCADEK